MPLFALLLSLGVPWRAMAARPTPNSASDRSPKAAARARADAQLPEDARPSPKSISLPERTSDQPVLYDPLEGNALGPGTTGPASGKPPRDRSVYRQRVQVGSVALVVLAGDLPQPRGDWSDRLQPEMFQFYFETLPEPKTTPVRAPVPDN